MYKNRINTTQYSNLNNSNMSYGNLDENSSRIIQPNDLSVELMQHQKTAVYAMKDLEYKGYVDVKFRYYDNDEKDLRLETSIGILGDKVGSGKTLIITSLILESPIPRDRPVYFASDRYTTIREISCQEVDKLNINVVMVPKGIQHQWEAVFKDMVKPGRLNFANHYDVSTREIFDAVDQKIKEQQSVTILCNDLTFPDVVKQYGGKKWNRFIMDEADTIQFGSLDKIRASFVWLVTGTTNGIPYSKKKYIKDVFGKNITWLPDFLTVKNKTEYIDTSIDLPKPNRITIKCHTPSEIRLLADHIPKNVMNMINAGNSDDAIRTLNCHVDTSDNIFKVISRNYEMAIKNKKIELEAEKKKKYSSPDKTHEHQKRLKQIESVVTRLETKLESMKKALYDANDEMCPVCMGEFEKPTLVDCCAHKYCFNCLALTLAKTNNKCPVCQSNLTKNRMHVVSTEEMETQKNEDTKEDHKREKIEELYDIIKRNKDGRFLVFADYDETFAKIEMVFKQHKIKYGILKGGGSKIKGTLDDFHKGKINVIMLNAKNFGAGMNLQCASDIVMYHRFSKEMEEQIIGRGQRLGREGTLNVYYLIHDNESNSYVNDNFNDLTYQEWVEDIDQRVDDPAIPEPLITNAITENKDDEMKKIVVKSKPAKKTTEVKSTKGTKTKVVKKTS